jgi:hypothetical protein
MGRVFSGPRVLRGRDSRWKCKNRPVLKGLSSPFPPPPAVVTQGATVDETIENLRGAVALHLDGEDPADFGLRDCPTLLVTTDVPPSDAEAS